MDRANASVRLVEELDLACERFIDEFSGGPLDGGYGSFATVDGSWLSMDMGRLNVAYRTPLQQRGFFQAAGNAALQALGNPSARISTQAAGGWQAVYNLDRNTGLVVVNNFAFPEDEVRALRTKDLEALKFSIATPRICYSGCSVAKALTDKGIERLIGDLDTAISKA